MKTALVTGGAGGVGLALSGALAREGWDLLWVDRSDDLIREGGKRLEASLDASPRLAALACDLSVTGAAERVHRWTRDLGREVDLLVNNAGFASYDTLCAIPLERDLAMLQVNVVALHCLTRLFLDGMLSRDRGTIVNIASVAAIMPSPAFVAYSATKAFVRHYTRCLDLELRALGSGVRAIAVCPAAIRDTGFQRTAGMERTGFFGSPIATTPEEVARDILGALRRGQRHLVTGRILRLVLPLARLLPDRVLLPSYRREMAATLRGGVLLPDAAGEVQRGGCADEGN